jgi:hypothetical protein
VGKQADSAAFAINPPFTKKRVPITGYAGEARFGVTDSLTTGGKYYLAPLTF